MPWFIIILVFLNLIWLIPFIWCKNYITIGGRIGATVIVLVLILILIILFYCLFISIAIDYDNISLPFGSEVEIIKTNNIIIEDNKIYYCDKDSTNYETVILPWYTLRRSYTGYDYIEIYKVANWKSPIREFLYGNSILSNYYVINLAGD